MRPLDAIIRVCVKLRIHPNLLTFVGVLVNVAAAWQLALGQFMNAGWIMINQGAADAAKEAGVKLIEVGPAFAGDLTNQLEVFENLVGQRVDAIAVAPVDSSGIAPAVKDATSAGIPIVAIDTAVNGADVTSFVATDNVAVAKEKLGAAPMATQKLVCVGGHIAGTAPLTGMSQRHPRWIFSNNAIHRIRIAFGQL